MNKKLLVLTLSLGLLLVGATSAFADDTATYGNGNGHMFYQSDLTVEERLALKIERIDQLVADGTITAEKGQEYKLLMTERSATCDGLGTNRDDHERLGLGLGAGNGSGNGTGRGHHGGFRK